MSDQARIASIEALEGFRSDLIRYMEKARTALEDMTAEVRRTRTWLDSDRSAHWSRELKLRTKRLEQAEQELYSANLTNPQASNALQKLAVSRASGGFNSTTAADRWCACSTRCSTKSPTACPVESTNWAK
jgi:hypothetical protein